MSTVNSRCFFQLPILKTIHFEQYQQTVHKSHIHLHAFILVFPSGFTPAQKLGLPLAGELSVKVKGSMITITGIHGPVPGYAARLEKSMDRFFASFPFGKIIWRANWLISTDEVLFKLGGSGHQIDIRDETVSTSSREDIPMAPPTYEPTPEELAKWKEESKSVNGDKYTLRMERQTLHRLEGTGAIVFGFKTILEPLSELREEGSGPVLADALEGLRTGNSPAMDVYENGVVWREPLVEYLRG
jgi:heme-dependent oxidative N-demethylase alpha subunit-like protein